MRHRILAAAVVALTACDGAPRDIPPLDRGLLSRFGCADISGAYAVGGADGRQSNGGFQESFLRDVIPLSDGRSPWDQVTIAGDASDSLIVTVSRSDSIAAAYSHEYRRVVHRGAEYDCGGGWVRSARTVHDPGPDRRFPRPDTIIGEVLLARTTDGGLVAKAEFDEAHQLTVWCGDGCRGIPLGTSRVARWTRWSKREPATQSPDPRPLAVARPAVEPVPEPVASTSADDRVTRAYARVTDGIAITGHDASDRRALILSVRFTTRNALSRYLQALDDDPELYEPRIIFIEIETGGGGSATVQVQGNGA